MERFNKDLMNVSEKEGPISLGFDFLPKYEVVYYI